jgi:uncharacterized protein involved in outer membrane biogenesis
MKWFKPLLILLAALLAVAVAVSFFVSLDRYIPDIEKAASARLNEPVSIKSIRFAALPWPHVSFNGIAVGAAGDLRLGKVSMTPDIFSLLQTTKVISSIEIDSLILTQKAIDRIPQWSKADAGQTAAQPVRVMSIRLDNALIDLGREKFGPFDARVSLDGKGKPESATIVTQGGKLKILIKPEQSHYLVDVSAKDWTLPVGLPLVFDELIVKGVATLDDANFSQINGRLYGGTANGKSTISWKKGLQVAGSFDVSQVEMGGIASMLSSTTHVSGRLSAKPVFSASADSSAQLAHALRLETPFNVRNGVLHGVNIQQAATNLLKQGATGGETHFDQLSGNLVSRSGSYHFTDLEIASGVLAADGYVTISEKKELSGRIHAQVKALGTSANVPLNVAGTVASPLLYPTGGTIAGAVVGSAILGPGMGTSVGAKVGGWTEGLFGKKK